MSKVTIPGLLGFQPRSAYATLVSICIEKIVDGKPEFGTNRIIQFRQEVQKPELVKTKKELQRQNIWISQLTR